MDTAKAAGLRSELMLSVFRLKQLGPLLPKEIDGQKVDLTLPEFHTLKRVSLAHEAGIEDIHDEMYISKPALCQMIGGLEKKGYLNRDLDKTNRRKRILTLTDRGRRAVAVMETLVETFFQEIIASFGEQNTVEFINLFNRFADVTERIRTDGSLKPHTPLAAE